MIVPVRTLLILAVLVQCHTVVRTTDRLRGLSVLWTRTRRERERERARLSLSVSLSLSLLGDYSATTSTRRSRRRARAKTRKEDIHIGVEPRGGLLSKVQLLHVLACRREYFSSYTGVATGLGCAQSPVPYYTVLSR